jgi:hypothetical protein
MADTWYRTLVLVDEPCDLQIIMMDIGRRVMDLTSTCVQSMVLDSIH